LRTGPERWTPTRVSSVSVLLIHLAPLISSQ
jgi:hypothetical protein